MSEKSAHATGSLDHQFEKLIQAADAELDNERERIIRQFVQAKARGEYVDAFSPRLQAMIRSLPSGATSGAASGAFASIFTGTLTGGSRSAMWAALIGAAYQLIMGLPDVYVAPEPDRLSRLYKLIKDVVVAAGVAGGSAYVAQQLGSFLTKNAERILSVVCNKDVAEKLVFKVVGEGFKVSAAAGALVAVSFSALTGFYHAVKSAWARYNGDSFTSEQEWEKMWEHLGLDNALRMAISTLSGVFAATLAPAIGTGYLSFLIPVTLYFLCGWVVEYAIARKNRTGGWSLWLASWFMPFRGLKRWTGGGLETFESRIPENLICGIDHVMVVDPVRSISTGIIYERRRLYKWLDDKHKDPITLKKAYSIDYIDSPLAAEYAKQIATLLGAEATPARE